MKLLRYGPKGAEKPGVLDDDGGIRDLSGVISDIDSRFLGGETFSEALGVDPSALPLVSPGSRLGAPVSSVGKFICVGLN